MKGDDILHEILTDSQVYIHYTDGTGLERIKCEGVIRADQKGYVYFSQEPMSEEDAHLKLFIGATTHVGRGSHIIVVRLDPGLGLEPNGLYEIRTRQTIRLDQHQMLDAGENPYQRS